jgi:16S rRNA (cytidine1402-2'-O)-methyltransferase
VTLHVVATPIGNLGDLSPRAVEVLKAVDAIVAEDTRHTRGLLTHFDIHKPLLSLPAFDEQSRVGPLIQRLLAGENLALVTDAGTPAISDPGEALVAAAWDAGVKVEPVPGPSAIVAALSASGLKSSRFAFLGFLPRKGESRRAAIELIRKLPMTVVLYEAGNRTGETLADLTSALGPRRCLVARELTKLHEEIVRATLPELAKRFQEGARGEVVLIVEAPDEAVGEGVERPPIDEVIRARLAAGGRVKDIAQELASEYELPRQQVYAAVLRVRDEGST